jgi:transposase
LAAELGIRTYIHERTSGTHRRWTDKDPSEKQAVCANKGRRGKQLSRLRSELTVRSFAHVCDTGGARRTWLRGLVGVTKRHLLAVAAHNLSVIMWALCGIGSPKALLGLRALALRAWNHCEQLISALEALLLALAGFYVRSIAPRPRMTPRRSWTQKTTWPRPDKAPG